MELVALYPVGPPLSVTLYVPGARVRIVPGNSEPAKAVIGVPLFVTVIDQFPASAVPPLSLTTCLITVSWGAGGMSSLVTVHVLFSARAITPVQFAPSDFAYPTTATSSTLYGPAFSVTVVPLSLPAKLAGVAAVPVTVMVKSGALLLPPSLFTTCLMTVS